MKRIREIGGSIPNKKIKVNSFYEKFIKEEEKEKGQSFKNNPFYQLGLQRLDKVLDGYLNKFDVSNFQFSNIELLAPTTYHLLFPEIFKRYKDEISCSLGCYHSKKGALILSDRGVGKTFGTLLWLTNIIRICPGPYKIALLGVQLQTSINLLYSMKNILKKYDIKSDFDEKPKESVLKMTVIKNGEEIVIQCFPGKGESLRGDNIIKIVYADEFFFMDGPFIEKKILPQLLRHEIGFIGTTTRNSPGHSSEKYEHSNKIMEVKKATRICGKCAKLKNWEHRKLCNHGEPPDTSWQDDENEIRETLGSFMDDETQAADLYGDNYKTPDRVFTEKKIVDLFNSQRVYLENFSEYSVSIDPNQEGESENATAIFGNFYRMDQRHYVCRYLNSFKSNVYTEKIQQFEKSLEIFVKEINNKSVKKPTYIFCESNSGNIGEDLKKWIKKKNYGYFMKVVHGRKFIKKLNKFRDAGYAKTQKRTECYVDNFSTMMEMNNIYFHKNVMTDVDIPYNTISAQMEKLKKQLIRFRKINGKYTGKITLSGHKAQDDLAIAFLSCLYMTEELNDPNKKLISEKIRLLNNYVI